MIVMQQACPIAGGAHYARGVGLKIVTLKLRLA